MLLRATYWNNACAHILSEKASSSKLIINVETASKRKPLFQFCMKKNFLRSVKGQKKAKKTGNSIKNALLQPTHKTLLSKSLLQGKLRNAGAWISSYKSIRPVVPEHLTIWEPKMANVSSFEWLCPICALSSSKHFLGQMGHIFLGVLIVSVANRV